MKSFAKLSAILACSFFTGSQAIGSTPPLDVSPGVELGWTTTTGNVYQLQSSSTPGGPWKNLTDPMPGDGQAWAYHDSAPSGSFFYQVLETAPGTPPTPANPVNAGFESGSGTSADHWSTGASQPPTRIGTDAHSGNFSMRSALSNVNSKPAEGLLNQLVVEQGGSVVPGQSYGFSFWAKQVTSGPSYQQQYQVQWLNSSGGVVGGTGLQNFSGVIGSWMKIEVPTLVAPAAAVEARVGFRFVTGAVAGGHGEVLIDDVKLGSGGAGTPDVVNTLPVSSQSFAKISWPSESGVSYQPQSSADLSTWTPLPPLLTGDGGIKEFTVPMTKGRDFFRLEMPDVASGIVALYNSNTVLEAPTTLNTSTALITYVADRVRDRHAREAQFHLYDHYLSWYWEQRVANIEIVDRVAKGGTDITFNYTTQARLNPAEFRTFFGGVTTLAQYNNNQIATLVSTTPSATPGETDYNYRATINQNSNEGNRPLRIGGRVEIEISQFLQAPRNGRNNYYGTTMLYIVGQGIVPWAQGNDLGFPGGVVGNVNRSLDSHPLPANAWLGGQTTLPYQYSNEPEHRFKQTAGNISPNNGLPFMLGRRLHHTEFGNGVHSEPNNPVFTEHIGKLGPKFIANSCVACHTNNGRALAPALGAPMFQSVVKVGSDESGSPHPVLGSVLQPRSTNGPAEGSATIGSYTTINGQYADNTPYSLRKPNYTFTGTTPAFFSVRIAPQLVGLGLLEAVAESTIASLADPSDTDADGISGSMQTVTDPKTGALRLGRFTNKGGKGTLSDQIASALNTDMGVTTSVFPILDGETTAGTTEIGDSDLDLMTRYVALLGVGARRDLNNAQALRGEQLFTSASCVKCHTPDLTTSPFHPMAELRDQTIRPYTDLLLHDMGTGLADNMGEGGASGAEWRTPPLWGIGLTAGVSGGEAYLHDGRARSLEEAILWHGGEGEASKEAFRTMPSADRAALIKFLKSL